MDKRWFTLSAMTVLILAGCESTEPDEEEFVAELSGAAEIPTPRTTPATGRAEFTVEENGTVSYTLTVNNIRNVSAAHIHGPAGADANAGLVVTLFRSSPVTGQVNGVLQQGTFAQADTNAQGVAVAPMDSVLAWMRTGRVYVNVHTNDGVAPTNTGPGDFPGGEIRGQIQPR